MRLEDEEQKIEQRLSDLNEAQRSFVETAASEIVRDVPTYIAKLRLFWLGAHHLYMGDWLRVALIWGAIIYAGISAYEQNPIGLIPLALIWLAELPILLSGSKRIRERNVEAYIAALAALKR